MSAKLPALIGLALFLLTATNRAAIPITCWDAASEFNDSANPDAANPSGVWSYGWKKNLTDKFFLATTAVGVLSRTSGWASASGHPEVNHNRLVVPNPVNVNPITLPPHALTLHPGLNGQYSVLRFTAPADGAYRLSGQFYALDDNGSGTTTDVWVVARNNKGTAFSGNIDSHVGPRFASFTGKIFQLAKGDTVDFQVGYGTDHSYEYDTTGLNALIEKIK